MIKKEYSDVDFEMFVMPFGENANKTLTELPAKYVLWLMEEDFCPPVLKAWAELNEEELREAAEDSIDDYDYGDPRF